MQILSRESAIEKLTKKYNKIIDTLNCQFPTDPKRVERHNERQKNAYDFLIEMKEVLRHVEHSSYVVVVNANQLQPAMRKAYRPRMVYEGLYVKVAEIGKEPIGTILAVWTAPISYL